MRPLPPPAAPPRQPDGSADIVLALGATAIAVVTATWAGAAAAAALSGHGAVRADLADAAAALVGLPGHLGHPAQAWPEPARSQLPGGLVYWACQVLVIVAVTALAVLGWRGWKRLGAGRDRSGPLGVAAEAGFARRRDLGRLAVRRPLEGRITLGVGCGRLLAAETQASLAVVGPTGCGKTAGFAIPALLEWRGPVVATSVKADLLEATIEHRRRRGTVWVYDPTGSSGHAPSTWSPLNACRTWPGAMRMAAWLTEAAQPRLDSVTDGDYWYSQARKGLAPYLHAAAQAGASVADLVRWVDTQEVGEVEEALRRSSPFDDDSPEPTDADNDHWDELWEAAVDLCRESFTHGDADPDLAPLADAPLDEWPTWLRDRIGDAVEAEWQAEIAREAGDGGPMAPLVAARALWGKEPRLRGSVFATMENVLASWADPGVGRCARPNQDDAVDLDDWLSGDNTIYVVAAAHEQARLRPVLTVLVQQAVRAAYDKAAASPHGCLPDPCLVLLDEAGNTAPLRDLPTYASTARSHGITLVTVWQDMAQIRATYRDRAQTVLNNHRAKLFGAGIADVPTLEFLSGLVGDELRRERNLSADLTGGRRSVSEHATYRRAAPVDVLRRIRPGEAVLVYGSELPTRLRLRSWFDDRRLRQAADRPDLIHR
ncbi:MAG: type IV secretory system conjugative DNA transfer family protein [Actinomycetota bacterium]